MSARAHTYWSHLHILANKYEDILLYAFIQNCRGVILSFCQFSTDGGQRICSMLLSWKPALILTRKNSNNSELSTKQTFNSRWVFKINRRKVFGFNETIRVSARKAFASRKNTLFHQTLQLCTLFIPFLISHGGLVPWVNTVRPNKFLTQETCPISKKQKEGLLLFFNKFCLRLQNI